jgi:predicted HTH transcriptional regulator
VLFTSLHRLLGRQPGPITDDMLDEAVTEGLQEIDDLDWKKELPPAKGITQTDFPKDVAALANSGGGVLVYGMKEVQRSASERVDVGDVDENYERALHSAAVTGVTPPVFGLELHRVGEAGRRALIVVVSASVDVPHLIYRGECFGAPVRNNADTAWMRERQVEAMYRARFDERRTATEALGQLYSEITAGRPTDERAWMFGVARPRIPVVARGRLERDDARHIYRQWHDARGRLRQLQDTKRP